MQQLTIQTNQSKEVVDITDRVQSAIDIENGLAAFTIQHTTAALTTADLDPGTDKDLLDFLAGIVPDVDWRHPHNPAHAPAHLLSSLIGPSVSVPVENGQLVLGTWQRIILVELDGSRKRHVRLCQISTDNSTTHVRDYQVEE